jgi:uncharacterized membrane protein YvbJ
MKKKPRFLCEKCGAEVEHDAKACPSCGRFFASVRCPACGFSGEEEAFSAGCPACGYSMPRPSNRANSLREKKPAAGPLPLWVYIFSVLALFCVFAALIFVITR